ncbi:MAG: 5-formyltetrahydrofolate cyclo-ligase [Bacteroidales bacterium]|nr:5-formyltetrahydrofolate cyclo-ligase [Bacteroidales bacterium]
MDKEHIRSKVKARKSLLSQAEKAFAAKCVFDRLEQSAAFLLAENILLYHSLPDELSTREFLDKWGSRKHFFLPRVNGVNLDILPYDRSRMAMGAFHIEEPQGTDTTDIKNIELIIVPAIAYDRMGNRIGRGKGYYDRLLATTSATTIGIGYDFQLIDEDIPAEPHDVSVDIVITDRRRLVIHHRKKKH